MALWNRRKKAVKTAEDSVDLYRDLASSDPDAHQTELVKALMTLAQVKTASADDVDGKADASFTALEAMNISVGQLEQDFNQENWALFLGSAVIQGQAMQEMVEAELRRLQKLLDERKS